VDGCGSEPIRDGIVVIVDDRITFVGSASDFSDRTHAQVIDALGGTILPGIIDAHVHGASDSAIRREFLINGVTAVCDLGSPLEGMPQFDEGYLGQDPVARGFHAGPIITAPAGLPDAVLHEDLNYEVGTPHEARAAVVDLYSRGADVIKVYLQREVGGVAYPMLGEEELTAIVEEAHALGLLVRAHVTYISLLDMAIQAGVDTIEHEPVNATQSGSQSISESQWQAIYEALLERMVEARIVMIPTLDRPIGDLYRASNPAIEQEAAIEIILGIVRGFHESGGVVGLGTDWNIGIGVEAGIPLGEMEMLSAAGLAPMDVIEAGTRHSAYVSGHGGELGTLEPGMLADVIVVDGDPLEDLQAMNQVVLVVKSGAIAVISEGMLYADEWPAEPTQQD
jgi:imidazolonepropionase-like amidohydrolase